MELPYRVWLSSYMYQNSVLVGSTRMHPLLTRTITSLAVLVRLRCPLSHLRGFKNVNRYDKRLSLILFNVEFECKGTAFAQHDRAVKTAQWLRCFHKLIYFSYVSLTNIKVIGYKPSTCFGVVEVVLIHFEPTKNFCTEKSAMYVFI